jgi:hypothetical protein
MIDTDKSFKEQMKAHKGPTAVYFVLRFFVIITMVAQFLNKNYENFFLCVLTLILFLLPSMIRHKFNVELPNTLEIIVLLFIFSAEILGEIREFYIMIPYWDTMLHTINGFMAASIGFALVDILNNEDRISMKLSPFFMAVVAFCFSMTIGVLWEFFEFGMDAVFHTDMQKDTIITMINTVNLNPDGKNIVESVKGITDVILVTADGQQSMGLGGYLDIGLLDTMEDLFVNFIGALVFSFFGYIYVKSRGKVKFVGDIILRKKIAKGEIE